MSDLTTIPEVDEVGAAVLVAGAVAGDERAWAQLVERYNGLLWSIARAHRLSGADAADVAQTSWLRLAENLDRLSDPERVGSWLATTARRECLAVIRRASRQSPAGLDRTVEVIDLRPPPDEPTLARERSAMLWSALNTLSQQCQELLRVLVAEPPPSYGEVSAALDMPVGSIGPRRARCLRQLRRQALAMGLDVDSLRFS